MDTPKTRKAKNTNISKMEKHFIDKIDRMQKDIDELEALCFHGKITMKELNERLSNTNDPHVCGNILDSIDEVRWEYNRNKEKKVALIKQRTEIKKMYKTFQRAVEERWLDGFGEGVEFATEDRQK